MQPIMEKSIQDNDSQGTNHIIMELQKQEEISMIDERQGSYRNILETFRKPGTTNRN